MDITKANEEMRNEEERAAENKERVEEMIQEARRNTAAPVFPSGEANVGHGEVIDGKRYLLVRNGYSRRLRRAFMARFNRNVKINPNQRSRRKKRYDEYGAD